MLLTNMLARACPPPAWPPAHRLPSRPRAAGLAARRPARRWRHRPAPQQPTVLPTVLPRAAILARMLGAGGACPRRCKHDAGRMYGGASQPGNGEQPGCARQAV